LERIWDVACEGMSLSTGILIYQWYGLEKNYQETKSQVLNLHHEIDMEVKLNSICKTPTVYGM
jgi:hypothetical protein